MNVIMMYNNACYHVQCIPTTFSSGRTYLSYSTAPAKSTMEHRANALVAPIIYIIILMVMMNVGSTAMMNVRASYPRVQHQPFHNP